MGEPVLDLPGRSSPLCVVGEAVGSSDAYIVIDYNKIVNTTKE
jgi:hypothetical protein